MAILLKNQELLFLMQPRTASTAISEELKKIGGVELGDRKHPQLHELVERGYLNDGDLKKLTIMVTIRNPYDSIASQYQKIVSRAEIWNKNKEKYEWIWTKGRKKDMVDRYLVEKYSFTRFIELYYTKYKEYDKNIAWVKNADIILKYENLAIDFQTAMSDCGISQSMTIPTINKTEGKKSYREYYTPKAKKIVRRVCRKDLDFFNYTF